MSDAEKTGITGFTTPFKRQDVQLSAIRHENGLDLLEIKIREGRRFTILELDGELAQQMGKALLDWAKDTGKAAE